MTDYYVKNGGNDAASGLDDDNAWETLSKVSTGPGPGYNAGDSVYLKKDDEWREVLTVPSSGSSGNVITFGAYGVGSADPIINGASLITPGTSWTDEGSDIWSATCTTEPNQVFFDGTRGVEGDPAEEEYDWYWDANVLYVYSTTDPDTAYTDPGVEPSNRIRCIYIGGKDYITVENINSKYANLDNIGIDEGSNDTIIDAVTSEYAYWRGVQISTAAGSVDNTIVKNSTISYNGGNGIWTGATSDNTLIQNNAIHHNCQLDIDGSQHVYTAGIKANNVAVTNLIVEHNTVYSEGDGQSGERGAGIWTDTNVQAPIIRYNKSYDNLRQGIYIELTSDSQVYYNLCWDNGTQGIELRGDTTTCSGNKIYNNVSYSNTGHGIAIWGDNTTSNCIDNNLIRNNIIVGNTNVGGGKAELSCFWGGENDGDYGSGNVYEYNCLDAEAAGFVLWAGVAKDTYDDFETVYGGTTYSVEADPLMIDPANDDFKLAMNSPCIDTGTDVSLTEDYIGTTVPYPTGGVQDIGAYENEYFIGGVDSVSSTTGVSVVDWILAGISASGSSASGALSTVMRKCAGAVASVSTVAGILPTSLVFGGHIHGADLVSTWTEHTGDVNYGNENTATDGWRVADRIVVSSITTGSIAGVVKEYKVHAFTGSSANCKLAIYSDNAGAPDAVVANTTCTESTELSEGWNTLTVTSGATLSTSTVYHIGLWHDGNAKYAKGAIYTADYEDEAYNGFPASFTVDGSDASEHRGCYVVLTEIVANVWKATLTTEPAHVFFDSTLGNKQTAIGDVDSANDWYWASSVLYVYSTSDPDTAYTSPGIEAGAFMSSVTGNANLLKSLISTALSESSSVGGILELASVVSQVNSVSTVAGIIGVEKTLIGAPTFVSLVSGLAVADWQVKSTVSASSGTVETINIEKTLINNLTSSSVVTGGTNIEKSLIADMVSETSTVAAALVELWPGFLGGELRLRMDMGMS